MLTVQLANELQPSQYLLEILSYLIGTKQISEISTNILTKLIKYWKKSVNDENLIKLLLNLEELIKNRFSEANLDAYIILNNNINFYYKLYNATNDNILAQNIESILITYNKILNLYTLFENLDTKKITKANIDNEFKSFVNEMLDIYTEDFNPYKKNVVDIDANNDETILTNIDNIVRVPSFIPELDYLINGFTLNTFYLFAGALGGGKSALLLNLAIGLSLSASVFGKNIINNIKDIIKSKINIDISNHRPIILYISLENTNNQILSRYFAIIKDILPFQDYAKYATDTKLSKLLKLTGNNIRSYEFTDNFLYPFDVENIIDNEISQNNFPIAIVIDYLDEFNVTENMELRHKLGLITKILRMIAIKYNTIVISATQLNRRGIEGKLEISSLSESIEHAKKTDFLAFINTFTASMNIINSNELPRTEDKLADNIFIDSSNFAPAMHVKIIKNRTGLKLGKTNIITSSKNKLGFKSLVNCEFFNYSIAHAASNNILEDQIWQEYKELSEYQSAIAFPFSYNTSVDGKEIYDILYNILSNNQVTIAKEERKTDLELIKDANDNMINQVESNNDFDFTL